MIKTVRPHLANEWLIKGDAILIDVREPSEFSGMRIPQALSLPLSHGVGVSKLPAQSLGKKVIIQCLHGARGERACTVLREQFGDGVELYNMDGGLTAWAEDGLPLVGADVVGRSGFAVSRQTQMVFGGLMALFVVLALLGVGLALYGALFVALALFMTGFTGSCPVTAFLQKMPWNHSDS